MQINVGHLDGDGVYSNAFTTYAFSGAVRQRVRVYCCFLGGVVWWGGVHGLLAVCFGTVR